MTALAVALRAGVVIAVAWLLLCGGFAAKWMVEAAWDRRHHPAPPEPDEIDTVTGPTDEQIRRAIRDYYDQNGGRP